MRKSTRIRSMFFAAVAGAIVAVGAVQLNANYSSIMTAFGIPVVAEATRVVKPPTLVTPPAIVPPKKMKGKRRFKK